MPTLNKIGITTSILSHLNIQPEKDVAKQLSIIIATHQTNTYKEIKKLSLTLTHCLKSNEFEITHSQILNKISQVLGYQNHHSMKHNIVSKNKISLLDTIDIENDSNIMKVYKLRDTLIKRFGLDEFFIRYFLDKNYDFIFVYERNIDYKTKVALNKFLRSYGIKPYKNTISLLKLKHKDKIQEVVFPLIQHYKSFFEASWYEKNNGSFIQKSTSWIPLTYGSIRNYDDLIVVDNYSNDLHWHIMVNFFDYLFNFGSLSDVKVIEAILNKTYKKPKEIKRNDNVFQWEYHKIQKEISYNFTGELKSTFRKIDQVQLEFDALFKPTLLEFEEKKLSLKDIIIDTCDVFQNRELYIDHAIQIEMRDYLIKRIYDQSREEFDKELKEIDDTEIMVKTSKQLITNQITVHVYNFIKAFNNVKKKK